MLNLIFTVLQELARRRYVTAKEFQGKIMENHILFSLHLEENAEGFRKLSEEIMTRNSMQQRGTCQISLALNLHRKNKSDIAPKQST